MFSNTFKMTRIEKLPVDNYEPSENENRITDILFPNLPQPQPQPEFQETLPPPPLKTNCCPMMGKNNWISDILLLVFCILLFQLPQLDTYLPLSNPNHKFIVKLLMVVIFIICIKKFMLY